MAIDNGDAYTGARHPQIALRSATELVILFQAIPAGETNYKLFRALVTIANNAVTSQTVAEIRDAAGARMPGSLTDPSFAIVTTDNTLRVAFSSFPSLVAGSPYSDVYYARVAQNTARVVNNTILLTTTASGTRRIAAPASSARQQQIQPRRLGGQQQRSDADDPTGIYYAMVQAISPGVVDNLAIGATQVLSGGYRWGFPNVLLTSSTNVWILAADEPPSGWSTGLARSIGIAKVNPYAVTHDGNPVNVNNVNSGTNASFFLNPPGGTVLSTNFEAYQPEAELDSLNRVHIAGYGFRYADGHGTPGRYYVMSLGTTASSAGTTSTFATIVGSPVSVGTGDIAFATQLPGDYTRPAFVQSSGKSVQLLVGAGQRRRGRAQPLRHQHRLGPHPHEPVRVLDGRRPAPRRGGKDPGRRRAPAPAALLALRRAVRMAFAR